MTRGLVIPALPFLPLHEQQFDGLSDYQAAVRGYIEPLTIARPALTMYVNEEAKLQSLQPNPRATALWWLHEPSMRGQDIVMGNAVVIPDEADRAALALLGLLPTRGGFRIEVLTSEDAANWATATGEFADWFDAAINALRIEAMWDGIRDIRVTTA